MGLWIAPLSPSQTIFLDKLPPEILTLIAKEMDYWTPQLSSLCKVNKKCNAACTSALYSGSLEFVDSKRSLNLFADTILCHRPDLATLVKDLEIYGYGPFIYRSTSPKRHQGVPWLTFKFSAPVDCLIFQVVVHRS